jgi:hypothetical protein
MGYFPVVARVEQRGAEGSVSEAGFHSGRWARGRVQRMVASEVGWFPRAASEATT